MIEALRQGRVPVFATPEEACVHAIGVALYDTRRVPEELYQQGVALFGEAGMVELIGVYGYYSLVAMTLNAFAVDRGGDAPLPFAE